jgi:hypothetical protein
MERVLLGPAPIKEILEVEFAEIEVVHPIVGFVFIVDTREHIVFYFLPAVLFVWVIRVLPVVIKESGDTFFKRFLIKLLISRIRTDAGQLLSPVTRVNAETCPLFIEVIVVHAEKLKHVGEASKHVRTAITVDAETTRPCDQVKPVDAAAPSGEGEMATYTVIKDDGHGVVFDVG